MLPDPVHRSRHGSRQPPRCVGIALQPSFLGQQAQRREHLRSEHLSRASRGTKIDEERLIRLPALEDRNRARQQDRGVDASML